MEVRWPDLEPSAQSEVLRWEVLARLEGWLACVGGSPPHMRHRMVVLLDDRYDRRTAVVMMMMMMMMMIRGRRVAGAGSWCRHCWSSQQCRQRLPSCCHRWPCRQRWARLHSLSRSTPLSLRLSSWCPCSPSRRFRWRYSARRRREWCRVRGRWSTSPSPPSSHCRHRSRRRPECCCRRRPWRRRQSLARPQRSAPCPPRGPRRDRRAGCR